MLLLGVLLAVGGVAQAQRVPRPDALPPAPIEAGAKAPLMATTLDEMQGWDRYPTFDVYVQMMRGYAERYPSLCALDTVGFSVQGRPLLALRLTGVDTAEGQRPEFLYASSIHGDELTGYVMLLRLADTLLSSYGREAGVTALLDGTIVYIMPLLNPDGAYREDNASLARARRYNADGEDLNRSYPDPFHPLAKSVPQENAVMMDFASRHHFTVSATLHGGAEVMNYPWDSFTSEERAHPATPWWREVCTHLVQTARRARATAFSDVDVSGVTAGGDWYVIDGGRQDYLNHYHQCRELTMEISTTKLPEATRLPRHWRTLGAMLVEYIKAADTTRTPAWVAVEEVGGEGFRLFPNPATDHVCCEGLEPGARLLLTDLQGRVLLTATAVDGTARMAVDALSGGGYLLRVELPSGAAEGRVIMINR